ncbi:MAG: hypothetical protein HY654_05325, partial [Acidobacteria bacterium]|nr:hypothetical protein [Acidobacteriota bacterium]
MRISRWSSIAGVGLAAVAVALTTFACTRGSAFEGVGTTGVGRDNSQYIRVASSRDPQAFDASATDSRPVVVTCGPGQRAVVRPAVLRGEPVSQVECLGEPYATVPAYGATPIYGTYDRPMIVDPYPRAIPVASEIRTV